jgi:phosphoglycolate phosphatase
MKVIVFDFDGVITDTFNFCYQIHNAYSPTTEAEYRSKFEGNINKSWGGGKPNPDFWKFYTPKLLETAPIEGMPEVIENLAKKYPLAIVSSTTSPAIKAFLQKFDLLHCFKEVLGNDVDPSKVKKLEMVLHTHGVSPRDVVFITDTLGDIREGKECGVESVAVTWGYHPRATLEKGAPFRIIDRVGELGETVEQYFKQP